MRLVLNHQDKAPLYRQVENHLREAILAGRLPAETRLPAIRALAKELGINRMTVETAYGNLEAEGLIFTRVGSGTYVLPLPPEPVLSKPSPSEPWPLWQAELLTRYPPTVNPTPDRLLSESGSAHPIPFTGIGDPRRFPVKDFARSMQSVLKRDGVEALGYGETNGFTRLRMTISQVLASQGLQVPYEQILITSGSQQALALVTQLLLKTDDVVLVESPTYNSALDLFRMLGLKAVGVPVDGLGMQVEQLEPLLQKFHPKLIYSIPNFQNPSGACMSEIRRRQLVALADRYNVPILEDDFVGDLRYEGRSQPTLKALDPGGRVIYTSTFSKMLMPGIRIGFVAAEGPLYDSLSDLKRLSELATSNLVQRCLEDYISIGSYQAYLRRSCQVYRKRRDLMVQAIRRYLPKETSFHIPGGGLFIWLRLPDNLSADALLPAACRNGVNYMPGSVFYNEPEEGKSYLRLNFVTNPLEDIEEGIKRLGKVLINRGK